MVEELRILDEHTLFDTDAHYVIPRYQRAYAWEDKEIGQLIDDINDIDIDSSENYYIGSLIVSKIQDKVDTYEVVDGQTTPHNVIPSVAISSFRWSIGR